MGPSREIEPRLSLRGAQRSIGRGCSLDGRDVRRDRRARSPGRGDRVPYSCIHSFRPPASAGGARRDGADDLAQRLLEDDRRSTSAGHLEQKCLVPVVALSESCSKNQLLDRRQGNRPGQPAPADHRPLRRTCTPSASCAMVGCSKRSLRREVQARLARHRGDDLDAENRVAAELEEIVVDADLARRRRTAAQIRASASSVGVRGATVRPARFRSRDIVGAGSALRSTLPLAVSGSAGRADEVCRDHVLGQSRR